MSQFCAKLLAAAIIDLFPQAIPQGGGATYFGFYHDFKLPFELQDKMLPSIEEKMRFILFEKRPVQSYTMAPASAQALFEHLGIQQTVPADSSLLNIVQIGSFADLCEEECTPCQSHFKLLSFTLRKGFVRIYGAAFSSKEELKGFIKGWKEVRCHLDIGQKQDLFSSPEEGLWIWHPEGEKVRRKFVKIWEEAHIEQNFQLISTPGLTEDQRLKYHAQVGGKTAEIGPLFLPPGKEGMLTPKRGIVDHSVIFCEESQIAQEINSSLQFIVKILNICTFIYEIKEERNLIEFRLFDGLGRQWVGPYIRVEKRPCSVVRSVFGSMERFVALFLEKESTVENQ